MKEGHNICDMLWYIVAVHNAPLKLFCSVTPFLPYGHYLENSWRVVPPLVNPNVSVKLNSIFVNICYVAQALENMDVWVVFQ
jgi:hypothetical protein